MKTITKTAAPESRRGTAPEIFKSVLERLIEETADNLQVSEMPTEDLKIERCRLAMLRLAAATTMPFSVFFEELSELVPAEILTPLYAQLDTLSAIYDVALKNEQDPRKEK